MRTKTQRENQRLKKALQDVLDMLNEWDALQNGTNYSGFAGFHAINQAERLLGLGGIRIEDNILITETGNENMTRAAFAHVA